MSCLMLVVIAGPLYPPVMRGLVAIRSGTPGAVGGTMSLPSLLLASPIGLRQCNSLFWIVIPTLSAIPIASLDGDLIFRTFLSALIIARASFADASRSFFRFASRPLMRPVVVAIPAL